MSIRVYNGPHASDRPRYGSWFRLLPVALALATVVAQIAWVLAADRFWWTHAVVIVFFLTTVSHAVVSRGVKWAATYSAVTLLFGYFIELLGTSTGLPFGPYDYATSIGGRDVPSIGAVPLIVPLAWTMMAYPALIVAWRIVGRSGRSAVALVGAIALSAWDLFLDPQMVGEGWWTWRETSLALPGIPEIPGQNYIGWLLSTALLMLVLSLLPARRFDNSIPVLMYLWMWLGGIIMNLFWLDRVPVALWGGAAMGAVSVPLIWRLVARP